MGERDDLVYLRHILDAISLVEEFLTELPWSDIIAMRHKIVHDYFGVALEVIWTTAKEDLPLLKHGLAAL